jgi:menaquinone-dependent protoporphyrinogen IX oxidase
VGQENIPDKLSPTFQDFISIYQNMLRADPNAMLEDLQKQIDKEKEKRKKYEKILKEFIKYLGKYNTRINDHSDNMEKIINGNNS